MIFDGRRGLHTRNAKVDVMFSDYHPRKPEIIGFGIVGSVPSKSDKYVFDNFFSLMSGMVYTLGMSNLL